MVRGYGFDQTKRSPDHAALKPAAWSRHPAVHQWTGYADALALYLLKNMQIWEQRVSPLTGKPFDNSGMNENVRKWRIAYQEHDDQKLIDYETVRVPIWWSDPRIHDSDKAILYRKEKTHYAMFRPYALVYEQYVWPNQLAAASARANEPAVEESLIDENTSHEVPAKRRKTKVKTEQVEDADQPTDASSSVADNTAVKSSKKRARQIIKSEPVDSLDNANEESWVSHTSGRRRGKHTTDAANTSAADVQLRRSGRHATR